MPPIEHQKSPGDLLNMQSASRWVSSPVGPHNALLSKIHHNSSPIKKMQGALQRQCSLGKYTTRNKHRRSHPVINSCLLPMRPFTSPFPPPHRLLCQRLLPFPRPSPSPLRRGCIRILHQHTARRWRSQSGFSVECSVVQGERPRFLRCGPAPS